MQKGRVAMAGNSGKWRRLIMAIAAVLYCSLGAFLVTSREGDSSGGREIQLTLTVPAGSTTTLSYYIYNHAFVWFNMGYAAAIALVLFALVLAITALNWKFGGKNHAA